MSRIHFTVWCCYFLHRNKRNETCSGLLHMCCVWLRLCLQQHKNSCHRMTENSLPQIVQSNTLQVLNLDGKTEAIICGDPEDEFDVLCYFGRMWSIWSMRRGNISLPSENPSDVLFAVAGLRVQAAVHSHGFQLGWQCCRVNCVHHQGSDSSSPSDVLRVSSVFAHRFPLYFTWASSRSQFPW